MAAPQFFSNYPGSDLADNAAQFMLARVPSASLARAVVLVPTRRATLSMREALRRHADGRTLLLPRILALADVGAELLALLGPSALAILKQIPPAMSAGQRHYLLTAQVQAFEQRRGGRVTLEHAMQLADDLADLQDRCTRAQVALTPASLAALGMGDYAEHWQQSLDFLNIVGHVWPGIEDVYGQTTQAAQEVAVLQALSDAWAQAAPSYPVIAVGSTGSQPATAALLSTIAKLPQGAVILPGFDPRLHDAAWDAITPAHPYYHLQQLLQANGLHAADVQPLGEAPAACSLWLEALCRTEEMAEWKHRSITPQDYAHLAVLPCQHAEEEARTIALILREGLETPGEGAIALITPDEALMARVDAHLARYGLQANRTRHGTLAQSQAGSVLAALLACIAAPEATQPLVALLRHAGVQLEADDASWAQWLEQIDRAWRGLATHRAGQLPRMPAMLAQTPATEAASQLVARIAALGRNQHLASAWVQHLQELLAMLQPHAAPGHVALGDALLALESADILGPLDMLAMQSLVARALEQPWRSPQFAAHPRLVMLTPVEARLQCFARVVLGNMQEKIWPGLRGQSPWVNLAQQAQLGLPGPEEHAALMAHDVLMQASAGEVFLTYPEREGGSPVARSRYIERLLTLLAASGAPREACLRHDYQALAKQLDAAEHYAPSAPPQPTPEIRPERMRVSGLEKLFTDPFSLYAERILQLRSLDEFDAEPESRDLGTLIHATLERLVRHWNAHDAAPDSATLKQWVAEALAPFAQRPAVLLFWQRRVAAALHFAIAQEQQRRTDVLRVQPEEPVAQTLLLDGQRSITLHGKIDRLEEGAEGSVIVDYKTGTAPSLAEMKDGRAVQLLAYALLVQEAGNTPRAMEYWAMPAGKRDGKITRLEWDEDTESALVEPFKAALTQWLDTATPLLARPLAGQERFANDYDGISRYDEWAG